MYNRSHCTSLNFLPLTHNPLSRLNPPRTKYKVDIVLHSGECFPVDGGTAAHFGPLTTAQLCLDVSDSWHVPGPPSSFVTLNHFRFPLPTNTPCLPNVCKMKSNSTGISSGVCDFSLFTLSFHLQVITYKLYTDAQKYDMDPQ